MSRHNLSAFSIHAIFAFLMATSFTSCTEDLVAPTIQETETRHLSIADFPEEVTVNNWESFVQAPPSVLDFHRKQELLLQADIALSPAPTGKQPRVEKNMNLLMVKGSVKAFLGNWEEVGNVWVSVGDQGSVSIQNFSNRGYNYFFGTQARGPICMELNTEPTNGMTALDMVLIKKHMTGQTPFENVWQLVAADVNNDGDINDVDLHNIQQVLLERESELPDTDNVVFIGEDDLIRAQTLLDNGNFDSDLLSQLGRTSFCLEGVPNRFLIKSGDVNGTANL